MGRDEDGGFYDPLFDLNRDGKLDMAEYVYYRKIIFGDDEDMDEDEDEEDDEDLDEEDEDDDDIYTSDVKQDLEYANIDPSVFKYLNDEEKYDALREADLDPEDYEDLFDDLDAIKEDREARESLEEAGIDYDSFVLLNDDEKLEALWREDLDVEDFEDMFSCFSLVEGRIAQKEELDDCGIDYFYFLSLSDEEKVGELMDEDLDPEDFDDLFSDYGSVEKIIGFRKELEYNDIDYNEFLDMSDKERFRALHEADLDPKEYLEFFDDPEKIADICEYL